MPPNALLDLPLASGIDQSIASQALLPTKLIDVTNGRFDKTGRITKRYGSTKKKALGTFLPVRLLAYRDELVVVENGSVNTFVPNGGSAIVNKGLASEVGISRTSFTHASGASNPDCAFVPSGTGFLVHVWDTGVSTAACRTQCTIVDVATGAEMVSGFTVSSDAIVPRVCVVGTSTFIVYRNAAAGMFVVKLTLSGSTWTFAAPVRIWADATIPAGGTYECAAMSDRFIVAVCTSAVAPCITLKTYDTAIAVLATGQTADASNVVAYGFGLRGTTGERVWLAYGHAVGGFNQTVVENFNPATLANTGGPFIPYFSALDKPTLHGVELLTSTSAAIVQYIATTRTNGGIAYNGFILRVDVYDNAGVHSLAGANRETGFSLIASKPFVSSGKIYCWAYVGGASLSSAAVTVAKSEYSIVLLDLWCDVTTDTRAGRPVAVAAPRFASPRGPYDPGLLDPFMPCSVVQDPTTGIYYTAGRILEGAGQVGFVRLASDFFSPSRWAPAEIGDTLQISGGINSLYDGSQVAELGYTYYPESAVLTVVAGGGMVAGTYQYQFVYEWSDARGQIYRSIPSAPVSATTAGANLTVKGLIPNYCVTSKYGPKGTSATAPSSVSVSIYRTALGTSSPYYHVASIAADTSAPESILFTDGAPDSQIISHARIYTDGGIEANAGPPGFQHWAVHKSRIWGIGDNGRTLWYTKAFTEGEGPSFTDDFTIFLEDSAGQAVGLASLDDKLIVFTKSRIYYLYGEGPNDAGNNSDYPSPIRLVSPVGCIDARSIVVTPAGVFFQSSIGIYLLTRGLEIQYVGQAVVDLLDKFPFVNSAILHPTLPLVYFSIGSGFSAFPQDGRRLVYDYRNNEWSSDWVLQAPPSFLQPIQSQAVRGGTDVYFASGGPYFAASLWLEDPSTYLDDGGWVILSAQTAHAKASGMLGYNAVKRVTFLGERLTPHTIDMVVASAYSSTIYEPVLFAQTDIDGQNTLPIEVLSHVPRTQKSPAVTVTISDGPPVSGTGTGQGAAFLGVTLEIERIEDTARLPVAQKG